MNTRSITIFLVLGMAAALFLTHSHLSRPSPIPFAGSPAAAQTPNANLIVVKSLPNIGSNDEDPWHRFEITVPRTNPPLDLHTAFLVDGKGSETVDSSPTPWTQPLPFKYRLDSDEDSRVKDILEAQGFPIKKNLVTYRFAAGTGGWAAYNQTVQFQHSLGPLSETEGGEGDTQGLAGEKIILANQLISDSGFKGSFDKVVDIFKPASAPKTQPGLVHHLVVYIMFQPHQGPPVKGNQIISRAL